MIISYARIITRFFIVLFAILFIYLFLYVPRIVEQLREKRSINVLVWPSSFGPEFLGEFEKNTGIKVYVTYFENYEELFVKLRAGKGEGYDAIMTSDYATDLLLKENVLKEIDKTKLPFWLQLYPVLLNHYYDPNNKYTVPYAWEVYGLGIDINYFDGAIPDATWRLLFDPVIAPLQVGMLDDARELTLIAAQYLFGDVGYLDETQLKQIQQLLIQQKKWVAAYTDMRVGYLLLSKTAPVVLGLTSDVHRIMREHDIVKFIVPKEGSFVLIDSFAMPAATEKDDLVYQFLQYIYQPEVMKRYVEQYSFLPAMQNIVVPDTRFSFSIPTQDLFKKLHFFKNIIPERQLNKIWITLKS